jgi:DtxR family Mn-dependent transcriptional regulator
VLSNDVERRIVDILGDPPVCPHGNPIPGSNRNPYNGPSLPLADSKPGPVQLVRISEQAQNDDSTIEFLASANLLPGANVEVLPVPDGTSDGTPIRSGHGVDVIPAWISALVWVTT